MSSFELKGKKFTGFFLIIEGQNKITENKDFLRKTSFRQNRFSYFVEIIQQRITADTWNVHQMFTLDLSLYTK